MRAGLVWRPRPENDSDTGRPLGGWYKIVL